MSERERWIRELREKERGREKEISELCAKVNEVND